MGDPIETPVSGFADQYPYFQRWEPATPGVHFLQAVATDFSGNVQVSQAVTVIVGQRTGAPPKPIYQGIVQVAEIIADLNSSASNGSLVLTLQNPGFGYTTPPKVVIDSLGTNGSGLDFNITQSNIDPSTGEIIGFNLKSAGTGYTSAPKIRLEEVSHRSKHRVLRAQLVQMDLPLLHRPMTKGMIEHQMA